MPTFWSLVAPIAVCVCDRRRCSWAPVVVRQRQRDRRVHAATQRRSVAKSVRCFQRCLSVCLFICQYDNFWTSKHMMIKLEGWVHCTKISAEFECGGHSPLVAHPQKCGVRLRRWENQHRLSSLILCQFSSQSVVLRVGAVVSRELF